MSRGGGRDGFGGDRDGKNNLMNYLFHCIFSYIHFGAFYNTFFFVYYLVRYYFILTNQIIYFILIRLLAVA